jgi:hypothetical protein
MSFRLPSPYLWWHAGPALARFQPETEGGPAHSGRGSPLGSAQLTFGSETPCTVLDTPRAVPVGLDRDVGTPPAGE